jgi:hypothetical protein
MVVWCFFIDLKHRCLSVLWWVSDFLAQADQFFSNIMATRTSKNGQSRDHCLSFFIWPLYCLSFDLRLPVTHSVSSKFVWSTTKRTSLSSHRIELVLVAMILLKNWSACAKKSLTHQSTERHLCFKSIKKKTLYWRQKRACNRNPTKTGMNLDSPEGSAVPAQPVPSVVLLL